MRGSVLWFCTLSTFLSGSLAAGSICLTDASRIALRGSSNIRHFTCRARTFSASLSWPDSSRPIDAMSRGEKFDAQLSLAVDGLDCGIKKQNAHLRETMNAKQHPHVEFRSTGYVLGTDAMTLRVDGLLTVNGVERTISVPMKMAARADALQLTGEVPLTLTEFDLIPARRFFGLLRVRDRVDIDLDLKFAMGADGVRCSPAASAALR
jgi:hypothetical protein